MTERDEQLELPDTTDEHLEIEKAIKEGKSFEIQRQPKHNVIKEKTEDDSD